MKAQALIARAVKLKDGTVRLTGATWGDGTPIKTVEIKIDDGPWQPAKIDRSPKDKYTWRFFSRLEVTRRWRTPHHLPRHGRRRPRAARTGTQTGRPSQVEEDELGLERAVAVED